MFCYYQDDAGKAVVFGIGKSPSAARIDAREWASDLEGLVLARITRQAREHVEAGRPGDLHTTAPAEPAHVPLTKSGKFSRYGRYPLVSVKAWGDPT